MGLFDDSKYVNDLKQEMAEKSDEAGDSRQRFIEECKTKIAAFRKADDLANWWKSEEQMKARRDFDLDSIQVEALKKLVIARHAALTPKKVA